MLALPLSAPASWSTSAKACASPSAPPSLASQRLTATLVLDFDRYDTDIGKFRSLRWEYDLAELLQSRWQADRERAQQTETGKAEPSN